jgi:hypothetical protein
MQTTTIESLSMMALVVFVSVYGLLAPVVLLAGAITKPPKSRLGFLVIGLGLVGFAALLIAMATELTSIVNEMLRPERVNELSDAARRECAHIKRYLLVFGSAVGFLCGSTGAGLVSQAVLNSAPFFPSEVEKEQRGILHHPMITFAVLLIGIGLFVYITRSSP